MRIKILHFLIFGVVCCFCLGCEQDGEDPYSLWRKYSHPEGDFSFYYLTPPFYRSSSSTSAHPVLLVEGYDTPQREGLDARIKVEAWVSPRSYFELNNERFDRWRQLGYEVVHNLDYVNHYGQNGAIIEVENKERWALEVIFERNDGCVILSAWTAERGLREDISLLVASFRPGQEDN